jgi:alkylhydroperoxidase family enzyme
LAKEIIAGDKELHGSPRERALAGFARILTDVPWAVDAEDIGRLRKEGISEEAIEQAILVTAFFNYFPRVADGTGIEFDYESPLPRINVDVTREALPRISPADWNPDVDGSTLPALTHAPHVVSILTPWRTLHAERTKPLGQTTRRVLFRIVAEELCDSAALGHWKDAEPATETEKHLASFARKLTKTPWAMNQGDVDALRAVGLSDEGILGAITLIAHQNTISRIHHALAAVRA